MIYIEHLKLPSLDEDQIVNPVLYLHQNAYPFHVLFHRGLFDVDFSDVTIITGGNGTGKSTLLNVIAEMLGLSRPTPYNRTDFFKYYIAKCDIIMSMFALQRTSDIASYGRIITSDEVFD